MKRAQISALTVIILILAIAFVGTWFSHHTKKVQTNTAKTSSAISNAIAHPEATGQMVTKCPDTRPATSTCKGSLVAGAYGTDGCITSWMCADPSGI